MIPPPLPSGGGIGRSENVKVKTYVNDLIVLHGYVKINLDIHHIYGINGEIPPYLGVYVTQGSYALSLLSESTFKSS
jgi:hypothetical protein